MFKKKTSNNKVNLKKDKMFNLKCLINNFFNILEKIFQTLFLKLCVNLTLY